MTTTITLATLIAAIAAVTGIPVLRRPLLTRHLLKRFRRTMPAVSPTEREALEAGGVWWDAELFSGRPEWSRLRDLPVADLTEAEQAFLDGPTDALCHILDDWQITHEDFDLSSRVWRLIREQGFFGLVIPKEYGGLGFSHRAHSEVVMKIASRSVTAAVTVMVPNSLGPAELLMRYGTDAQRRRYLPRLARGQEIPCFALTGPQAGSDAASTPDTGVVCRGCIDGRETLGLRVNFEKRYITLAPVATLIGLAFRVEDPHHLLGDDPEPGITVALIPSGTPGVSQGQRHLPLGIPFQNGPLSGRDVFVPLEWVIGGREGVGQGWRMLMECLSEGRGISLPALSTGAGKLATREIGAYARVRRQFGLPIGAFEGIEAPLARIAGRTYQMEAARRVFLAALDAGERPAVLSAVLKYQLTERYRQVVNDAMDIQGGAAICLGPSNLMGRVYQAIPIAITVEGANILTRNLIVFGQGALRCHPYLLRELRAASDPDGDAALHAFDRAAASHALSLARNLWRTAWLGLTRGRGAERPLAGEIGRYYQRLDWLSTAFALNADLAMMTLGGSLKRRERLSARLGDVLSLLFMGSCALKHFEDQGARSEDLPLLRWAMEDHLHGIQHALGTLWGNLPNRPLAWVLRRLTFPYGAPFAGPSDRLDHAVAELVQAPADGRDRLTEGVFRSRDQALVVGRLELALEAAQAEAPIVRRLKSAQREGRLARVTGESLLRAAIEAGVIRADEAEQVREAERLRGAVIAVDSFDSLIPERRIPVSEQQDAQSRRYAA